MDRIIPWGEWKALIQPYYYKGERGNKPYELELMLRLFILQNLYNLADEGTVAEVIDSRAFSEFCGIDSSNQVPDGDRPVCGIPEPELHGQGIQKAPEHDAYDLSGSLQKSGGRDLRTKAVPSRRAKAVSAQSGRFPVSPVQNRPESLFPVQAIRIRADEGSGHV